MTMIIWILYSNIHIMRSLVIRGSIIAVIVVVDDDDNNNMMLLLLLLLLMFLMTMKITMTMIHFTTPKFTIGPQ